MKYLFEHTPSIDSAESGSACPIDPDRARKLSAEVLRSQLRDLTTPLDEPAPPDTNAPLQTWKEHKSTPPTGAEVFYFHNRHGR